MSCYKTFEPASRCQNEHAVFAESGRLTATVRVLKSDQQAILYSLAGKSRQGEKSIKRSKSEAGGKKLSFKPIDNLDSLENLEEFLKEEASAAELKKKLSVVCRIGKGKGPNNCFILIDVMFSRNFLTTCSWAGGTRGEGKKICFKAFNRVIQFFFSIIYDSDNTYSLVECEAFFKSMLRNAVKRNAAKRVRASATKLRLKKRNRE